MSELFVLIHHSKIWKFSLESSTHESFCSQWKVTEELEKVKQEMEEKGSSMTDGGKRTLILRREWAEVSLLKKCIFKKVLIDRSLLFKMNLFEGGVHGAKLMSDNQYTISLINELRRVIFTIIQDFIQTISVQK